MTNLLYGRPIVETNLNIKGEIKLGTLDDYQIEYEKARDKAMDNLSKVMSQREIEIPDERLKILYD